MDVHPLHAFEDNYIWLLARGMAAVVVDPGDAAPVLAFLKEKHWVLSGILLTHYHRDHVGGVAALLEAYPVPVYGPAVNRLPVVTHPLQDQDRCAFPDMGYELQVLAVPGHTREHIAYYGRDRLFCGDTLFAGGCGRILDGTAQQMYTSLQHLSQLPPGTLMYCGHEYTENNLRFALTVEPSNVTLRKRHENVLALRQAGRPSLPSRLEEELATNPFLRADHDEIRSRVEARSGRPMVDALDTFTELRKLKDRF